MKRAHFWLSVGLAALASIASAIEVTVRVVNFDFVNASNVHFDPTIHVGDSVKWVLVSGFHTAKSAAGQAESWDSGTLTATGFSKTFTHAGTFNYHCGIHGFDAGGGNSGGMSGKVIVLANDNPTPSLTSISPNSRQAGLGGFTLTVNGANFVSNSVVRWNGQSRTTTFSSSTQLTASISASDVAVSGSATVTVFNPSPGGGTSGSQTFTITPGSPVTVPVNLITVIEGDEFAGGLSELVTSDDLYYDVLSDGSTLRAIVEFQTFSVPQVGTSPLISFTLESLVTRPGLSQEVAMFNQNTSTYVVVDGRIAPIADSTATISLANPLSYVDTNTHNMRAKITWSPINDEDPSQDGWLHRVDLAHWTVSP